MKNLKTRLMLAIFLLLLVAQTDSYCQLTQNLSMLSESNFLAEEEDTGIHFYDPPFFSMGFHLQYRLLSYEMYKFHSPMANYKGLTLAHDFEINIMKTFNARIGLAASMFHNEKEGKNEFNPNISIGFKEYFNLERRWEQGKNVKKFAGNYFSAYLIHSPNQKKQNRISWGFSYGLRRNISEFISFGLDVEFNIMHSYYGFFVYPKIGFIL